MFRYDSGLFESFKMPWFISKAAYPNRKTLILQEKGHPKVTFWPYVLLEGSNFSPTSDMAC